MIKQIIKYNKDKYNIEEFKEFYDGELILHHKFNVFGKITFNKIGEDGYYEKTYYNKINLRKYRICSDGSWTKWIYKKHKNFYIMTTLFDDNSIYKNKVDKHGDFI